MDERNDAHPELQDSIITHLSHWHDGTTPPTTTYTNDSINRAVQDQKRLGLKNFIDGFISKEWGICQQKHMERSRKSPTLWMAKLQNKIWQIAWTMWDHRNKHLHEENKHEHATTLEALNEQIKKEIETGLETLPRRYTRLFLRSSQSRLKDTIEHKKQWLTSVWAARDRMYQPEENERNAEVRIFYERWKKRNT